MATLPSRRTETMVVPLYCSIELLPDSDFESRFFCFEPAATLTLVLDSCSRVSLVVYLGQMLEVKVCVHLSCTDVRVAE